MMAVQQEFKFPVQNVAPRPVEQQNLFKDNHGVVNINHVSSPDVGFKKDECQNVRMSSDLKQWLVDTSTIISDATGDAKYGASTLACEAISLFRTFFHVRKKLLKYQQAVVAMLETLP